MASHQAIVLRHRPGATYIRTGNRFQVKQSGGRLLGSGFTPEQAWEDALEALENNDPRALQNMQ